MLSGSVRKFNYGVFYQAFLIQWVNYKIGALFQVRWANLCVNLTKGQIGDFRKISALAKVLIKPVSTVQTSPLAGYACRSLWVSNFTTIPHQISKNFTSIPQWIS